MKNITADNAKVKLERAKLNLEVFSDMYTYFEGIFEAGYYTEEYKLAAHSLIDAIVSKIDPIDY